MGSVLKGGLSERYYGGELSPFQANSSPHVIPLCSPVSTPGACYSSMGYCTLFSPKYFLTRLFNSRALGTMKARYGQTLSDFGCGRGTGGGGRGPLCSPVLPPVFATIGAMYPFLAKLFYCSRGSSTDKCYHSGGTLWSNTFF